MKVKFLLVAAILFLSSNPGWGNEDLLFEESDFSDAEEILSQIGQKEEIQEEITPVVIQTTPREELFQEEIPMVSLEAPELVQDELVQEATFQPLTDPISEMAQENQPVAALSGIIPSFEDASIKVDLKQLYFGAPVIYTILLFLSFGSLVIWLYNILLLRYVGQTPDSFTATLRIYIKENRFDEAFAYCNAQDQLLFKMVGAAIPMRKHGAESMLNAMSAEGKRHSSRFWQSVSLLNDIAVIAPMLGLLGTVMGMFYAFYDLNRSRESISALFDGLGISVGTTVGGIFVAILSLIFYATLKLRLVKLLTDIESQATRVAITIENTEG